VFSRAFGEEEDGAGGGEWKVGVVVNNPERRYALFGASGRCSYILSIQVFNLLFLG